MNFVESAIAFFIGVSLFVSPSTNTLTEQIETSPPHIYIIPYQEFHNTFCGCPCSLQGTYLGEMEVDGVKGKTILLAGVLYGNGYLAADGSQLAHELEHYKQDLQGRLFIEHKTNEEAIQHRIEIETEAYEAQNRYNELYNLPQIDASVGAELSTNWASGRTGCMNNETPLPMELRKSPHQLIFEYQHSMLESYRK